MRIIEMMKEYEIETIHTECGAKVGYYPNEILYNDIHEDYQKGKNGFYYIVCPNCGKKIEVDKYENS